MNIRNLKDQPLDEIQVKKAGRQIKGFLIWLLKVVIIVGISYIILGPLITIVANSFFTANDLYNPVVMLLPAEGTLQNYITSFTRMTYPRTLATTFAYVISLTLIQIFICSMAGYGFARYEFPFKKVLFGCVILTIVIPNDTLMLPLYTQFRNFDIFGIIHLVTGHGINLLIGSSNVYRGLALGCGHGQDFTFTFLTSFFADCQRKSRRQRSWTVRDRFTLISASCWSMRCRLSLPSAFSHWYGSTMIHLLVFFHQLKCS